MDWFKVDEVLPTHLPRVYIAITMAPLTNMPAELFRTILSEVVGAQLLLPPANKWTDSRLRLAQRNELRRRQNLRPYLGATRAVRDTAINIHY